MSGWRGTTLFAAPVLTVALAGCGSSSGAEPRTAAGVRAMHKKVDGLAQSSDFDTICKDYLTPLALQRMNALGNCAAILQEQAAREPASSIAIPITSIVVRGNTARFTYASGRAGEALYLGQHWRLQLLTPKEQQATEAAEAQARRKARSAACAQRDRALNAHIVAAYRQLRRLEAAGPSKGTGVNVLQEANLTSKINQLEAELEPC